MANTTTKQTTKKRKKKVHLFFTVDDNYVPYLQVTLASIVDHASKKYNYDITVVHHGLSSESKKKLRCYNDLDNINVHFYSVDFWVQSLHIKLDLRDYYTITTYYRLFLPEIFKLVSKGLYLDSDIVLLDDVAKLYFQDIGDNYAAAVPDQSVQIYDSFIKYVEEVIEVPHEQYFNAGVLLMNFKKMREEHFQKQAFDLLEKVTFKVAQDQDALNYLCKGKVKILPLEWNTMPLGEVVKKPSLIHYNLMFKPWNLDNIQYEEYFWKYAERAGVYEEIVEQKQKIPQEIKDTLLLGVQRVQDLCDYETTLKDVYHQKINSPKQKRESFTETVEMEVPRVIDKHRKDVLDKIVLLERQRKFDQDVEDDPPYRSIQPGEVDYLRKKWYSKFKTWWATKYSTSYFKKLIKKGVIKIDGTSGKENLKKVKSGAIITSNHFNPFDSIPIHLLIMNNSVGGKKRKLWQIIKEGNWSFPGVYGYFMRNCRSLPLSINPQVMKEFNNALKTVLGKGDLVLIYPEQSLWWNYRKPKPLKPGAFRFAVANNVPVIPTFITMRDTDETDGDGLPIQSYALHILKPIYPDPNLTMQENIVRMQKENEAQWKECYEHVYGIPLEYLPEEE